MLKNIKYCLKQEDCFGIIFVMVIYLRQVNFRLFNSSSQVCKN